MLAHTANQVPGRKKIIKPQEMNIYNARGDLRTGSQQSGPDFATAMKGLFPHLKDPE